ncbi:helix-turn-helix transcriptional regulator [Stenotrophomonas sp.]|uniref:helix-turn-helix domain-containing protein n=1 Tax=Stenotrophomonas sp. TaxID=69392 RepID=UPI00289DB9D0|nr:helix-turn-helix transcriptional regulator [Stenotrophomonas sp.]
MRITKLETDDAIQVELGLRVSRLRLSHNMSQDQLATAAGVSKRTVQRLEGGSPGQLTNMIRCLRALEQVHALDALLPPDSPNPIDLVTRRGRVRQRSRVAVTKQRTGPWVWGDQK